MVPMTTTFDNVTYPLCVSIDPCSGRGHGWRFHVWALLPIQEENRPPFVNDVIIMSL